MIVKLHEYILEDIKKRKEWENQDETSILEDKIKNITSNFHELPTDIGDINKFFSLFN